MGLLEQLARVTVKEMLRLARGCQYQLCDWHTCNIASENGTARAVLIYWQCNVRIGEEMFRHLKRPFNRFVDQLDCGVNESFGSVILQTLRKRAASDGAALFAN